MLRHNFSMLVNSISSSPTFINAVSKTHNFCVFCDAALSPANYKNKSYCCLGTFVLNINLICSSIRYFTHIQEQLLTFQSYFQVKSFISHHFHIPIPVTDFIMVYFIVYNLLSCGSFNMDIFYLHITYGSIFFIKERRSLSSCLNQVSFLQVQWR